MKTEATNRPPVAVIDAGVGNLGNLFRALRHVGADPELTTDPATVERSTTIVLPGVGAFRPPRERMRGGLERALRSALDSGAHLLGICIGYQLLFDSSTEFGTTDGLGLLPGRIDRLPESVALPQIGWNRLVRRADHPLLSGIPDGENEGLFYFVHSYAPYDVPETVRLAEAVHGGAFVAVAGRGRVYGTQFHPEKSGPNGLRLLRNFLDLAENRAAVCPN
ncbi:MAG: imidazole glycerol phosphate synthase subunit HisH [Thermoanaerobaculia bacterium]|nr:imidazole glycerol phosphate synthase subunit HisH [Thermoanaerobaculia bacterium]